MKRLLGVWGVALLVVVALPAAADDTIYSGADLWRTVSGSTYTSFRHEPIPAGFFCPDSPPFEGTIAMKGAPLVTEPPGYLGSVDTVVHRLDDTTFDDAGVARTRIRLLAMSLAGIEPLEVGCAQPFDVGASLAGEQPTTEMKIYRESPSGGTYVAPLALNIQLTFTPAGRRGVEPLRITRYVELGPGTNSVWSTSERVGTTGYGEPVRVDTDGDGTAESVLPGRSNFVTGTAVPADVASEVPGGCGAGTCPGQSCHCNPNSDDPYEPAMGCRHLHCVEVCTVEFCMY